MKQIDLLTPSQTRWDALTNSVLPQKFYPRFLLVLILLGFLPLLIIPGIPGGHDSAYHLSRLVTLHEGLKHGVLLPLVNYDAMDGFGYAPGLFYSDLWLYPFGLLSLTGLSIVSVYKLFLVIWGLLTAFSMYRVVHKISRDAFSSFASALLYCWSSYFAVDVFTRAAVGEIMAFLFVPWCIYGLWLVLYDEPKRGSSIVLALGYAGLFYAHNITFVLMSIIGFLLIAFNLPSLLRDLRRIWQILCAGLLALPLAAFALVPMAEQLAGLKFNLTGATLRSPIADRIVPFMRLFLEVPYMKMEFWLPPGIGLIFVITALQRLRIKSSRTPSERFRDLCLVTGFFALISATEFLPWQGMMRPIAAIQFPWRLYLPATAFLAVGGGLLLGVLLANRSQAMRRTWIWILLCGCGFPWWFNMSYTYAAKISEHAMHKTFTREQAAGSIVSGIHFIPQGKVNQDYDGLGAKAPVSSSSQAAKASVMESAFGTLQITFSGFNPGDSFEIPRIYYKGYHVDVQDGGSIDISNQEHFLFRPNAAEGVAEVYFRPTKLHLASLFLSASVFVGILLYCFLAARKQAATKDPD